jgi:hypothetical protein
MKGNGSPMAGQRIVWRRLDQPGHDSAHITFQDPFWCLEGVAVFIEDKRPCKLDYQILCDYSWKTILGRVNGWVGKKTVELEFAADAKRRWRINKKECPSVEGCIDIDLSFTPATNLLPIRRLQLPVGKESVVRAAWLRFPVFSLEPLEQKYRHLTAETYRYESLGGKFIKKLTVNSIGFVTNYPGFWKVEGAT